MPLKNLLLAVFLLVFEAGAEQCCPMKTVGNISYSLLSKPFHGELPSQCANGCVYTITNTSNPRFCFQKGKNILLLCITTACSFPVPIHFHTKKKIITRSAAFSGEIQLWSCYLCAFPFCHFF